LAIRPAAGHPFALAALLALTALLLSAAPAMAHKLNVSTEVEGKTIRGRAYFHLSAPAQQAKVEALAPDGRKLAETTTDADGNFTIEAQYRCNYRLVVNAGGGHGGEAKVGADELPDALPPLAGLSKPAAAAPSPPEENEKSPSDKPPAAVPSPETENVSQAGLKQLIEAAVRKQVEPLERKLQECQEKVRMSDVLGGIGYIVGFTGLLFYFLGTRRKDRATENQVNTADKSAR
jgi:nickel transport protein